MKRNFFLIFFLSFICFSCTTIQNIYTITADYGQLFFIRSTKMKNVPEKIKSVDFDITVRLSTEGEIIDNPVLNYTLVFDKKNYSNFEKTEIYFTDNNKKMIPQNSDIVFKEIHDNKDLEIRYSSVLDKEDFLFMVNHPEEINVCIKVGDNFLEQKNKDFTEKLSEIGVLIL